MKGLYYFRTYPVSFITGLVIVYLSFFTPPSVKIAHEIPYFDKWVHFLMYAGLCTLLWSEFFRAHALPYPLKRGWIGACALPIIFSALIEIGQSLTLYRSGDVMDFLCNSLGAICAGCVATYIYNPFYKRI